MRGLVQIYTGEGKGKTTAALGLALRAIGQGLRVYFVQFLKPQSASSGEMKSAARWGADFRLVRLADDSFLNPISASLRAKTRRLYAEELDHIQHLMQEGSYNLFVLDEVLNALHLGLIEEGRIERLIYERPSSIELIFTGQPLPKKLIPLADLISEIKVIKHPYDQGIKARPGIEY